MMNRNLYLVPVGLITTLLISLLVGSASADNRAASPSSVVSARKPPYNGSIFGKRSVLPALQSMQDGYSYIPMRSNEDNSNFAFDLPDRGQIGLLLQQQEALIRLATNQCLAQQQRQQDSDGDSVTGPLCASLLMDFKGGLRLRNSLAGSY